ncbi:MAG TPA: GH25 family lysozyme [Myxococcales bacterium]|nr:GH25 family lysozyme [Myxococcales bacterium]
MNADSRWIAITLASLSLGLFEACGGLAPTSAEPLSDAEQEALQVCESGATTYGIDISNNNGANFDLAASKANGVRFVYLKASQGDYFTDDTYDGYRKKAADLGLIHGAYHFFDPSSDPNKAADLFLKIIGSAPKGDLPPALDWEITSGVDWSTAFARAKIFLDRVEQATGRTPLIYTYPDFFGTRVPDEFAKYPLWISNPGNTCPQMPDGPWDHFTIFQYNTSGLDHDHYIGDLKSLQGFADESGSSGSSGSSGGSTGPSEPPAFTQVCNNAGVGDEGVLSACDESAIRAIAPSSAKDMLDRAFNWVGRVWYSQDSYTDGYRQDCSGFVSYVWQLGTSDTTYSLAGGPWNNDLSVRINWGQLTPGDAINFPGDWQAGTGHVELWGGWLNRDHTEYCAIEEFDYGYTAAIRPHSIYEYWDEAGAYADVDKIFLPIRKKGYVPSTTTCETLASPIDQVESNGGLTAVTWADGHIEVFARTDSGRATHVWTDGATDKWHAAEDLTGSAAACGVASVVSFAGYEHAEVFDSAGHDGDTKSSFYDKGWKDLSSFGGENLEQVSTLRWNDEKSGGWNDGRTEVFGLAAGDHHIYHKYYDPETKRWSSWDSLGGDLATGASPILNRSGDALLFATDAKGEAFYDESDRSTGEGWKGWKSLGGTLGSRPVAVRDPGGTVRIFARGQDGKLYGAHSTDSGFSKFEVIDDTFAFAGEPSAAVDDGKVEVFVRGLSDKVSYATMDPKTDKFGRFVRLSEDDFASDPFAWQRPDGRVEVFAVTTNGHLGAAYHSKTGWKAFERIATGIDPCPAPQVEPECPNGNGLYCGGHGVKGTTGTLYSCDGGKVTELEACSDGCQDNGSGGKDACKSSGSGSCGSNADCASDEVCEQPALICAGETGASLCTTEAAVLVGQSCTSNSDCNPATGGTMVCGACPSGCQAAGVSCCVFGG